MKRLIQIFIPLLLGYSPMSIASVNLVDGSFQISAIDIEIRKGLYLERTYSSRSLHLGMFGFGWCSNLELRIELKGEQIEKHDCLKGLSVLYKKQTSDKSSIYRSEQDQESRFVINGKNISQIFFDGEERLFDLTGKWIAWRLRDGTLLQFKYDKNDRLQMLSHKNQVLLQFGYSQSKEQRLVLSLEANGIQHQFQYQGPNLIQSLKGKRILSQFEYDQLHNLTKVIEANKKDRVITYDLKFDRINSILEGECRKTYSYEGRALKRQSVQVLSQCEKSNQVLNLYEIEYAISNSGEQKLKKLSQISADRKKETYFDLEISKPINIYQDGRRTDYVYDSVGRLIAKNGYSSRIQFSYPPQDRRPSSVVLHRTDPFGKSISTESSDLFYDSLGNLNLVRHSSGEAFEISFDSNGRSLSLKPLGALNRQPTGLSNKSETQNSVTLAFLKEFVDDLPL